MSNMSNDFVWYAEELPDYWSYGVTSDGRVFFIDDARHFTTWCHPLTLHPVQSGYYEDPTLPKGWQLGLDSLSNSYFVNHLNQVTSGLPPITTARNPPSERTYNSTDTTQNMRIEVDARNVDVSPVRVKIPDAPVEMEGWLLRQEGLFKQWKKRWFSISRNQLFCYKDVDERRFLSSYPLIDSTFTPCYGDPGILKTFAFKVTQKRKKPVYLAAETQESYDEWLEALVMSRNSDLADRVFREIEPSPLPRHLAQRSRSVSGPRDGLPQTQSFSDNPHKRSQSYHNLDRPRMISPRNPEEAEQWRGLTGDVGQLQRGYSEHRSRTAIYSPGDVTRSSMGNLAPQISPNWNHQQQQQNDYGVLTNQPSDGFSFKNSNLPLSSESPIFRQHRTAEDRGNNRISNSSYASVYRSSQIPQGNYQEVSHLRLDGSRVNSSVDAVVNSPLQHHSPAYLTNMDESTKTWKSFERSADGIDTNRISMMATDQYPVQSDSIQIPQQDRSLLNLNSNPEQLYSRVVKHKGGYYHPSEGGPRSPPNNQQPQRSPYLSINSRNTSNRSLLQHLPQSDNFSSVSKYSSRPTTQDEVHRLQDGVQRSGNSMGSHYNQHLGADRQNFGRSVDSLNTFRTNGSSKSSSKNTYHLNSNSAGIGGYDDNLDRFKSNSYLGNSTNKFRSPGMTHKNPIHARSNIPRNFSAIKEDPDMPEDQVLSSRNLEDLQKKLASHTRLRLSISVQDLMGKSYEEVVLFLIQLKRSQSELQKMCGRIKKKLNSPQTNFNQSNEGSRRSLEAQIKDVERQMEVTQPLINLLDNMLTMGSLFSGDGLMYASQYMKNQLRPDEFVPPKAMLEFNRGRQEALIVKTQPRMDGLVGEGSNVARVNELETGLKELHGLDVLLQEKTAAVTGLQKDKEMIERAINEVKVKLTNSPADPLVEEHLTSQKVLLEKDLSATVIQLAEASKQLEDTTSQMVRSEQRIIQLRNKLQSSEKEDMNTISYGDSSMGGNERLRRMEREVEEISNVLRGTSNQMNAINDNISSIKRSRSSHNLTRKNGSSPDIGTTTTTGYMETDLDFRTTRDIGPSYQQGRISRRDQYQSLNCDLERSSRSSSMTRKNNDLNQYQSSYEQKKYTEPIGNRSNSQYLGSTSGLRNHGYSSQMSSNQNMGPRSHDLPSRGHQPPYSQRSVSVVKPTLAQGSYEQKMYESSNPSSNNEMIFDERTIDNAVFHPPPRVQIPQRYVPDANDTMESIDPVDIYHKQQKAEQVKKLLAIQSLQDFTLDELGRGQGNIEDRVRSELKEREDILEMKKNLARQVTERSRNFVN